MYDRNGKNAGQGRFISKTPCPGIEGLRVRLEREVTKRIMNRLLRKFTWTPELEDVIEECKGIFIPTTKSELYEMVFGTGRSGKYDVVYDVPGKGEITEATVVRAKNGVCVNYAEDYMRRRDPDCMRIADDKPTDKPRFKDVYGYDFDEVRKETMYGLISLPAFYCQYLVQYPELVLPREEYIESLYERILDYVDVFPDAPENELLFFYLRQLSCSFVETKGSVTYGEFLLRLLLRFAPDIYIQSYTVARAAAAFCSIILAEEPAFFDDIPEICAIEDRAAKQKAVSDYAWGCGLFHDAGKINFINLYAQTGRQWFEEEYEMAGLHTVQGSTCLAQCASTKSYAVAALGHHSWYDGSGGYPETYRRLQCPERQMVDVIGLIDWLENVTEAQYLFTGAKMTFDEAVRTAISLEGRRFSPLLTARLRDKHVAERLREAFREGRKEAYRTLYEGYRGKKA